VEIERKFVLASPPPGLGEHPHARIEQGYVALDPNGTEVRVRRKGDARTLTIKSGAGLKRTERESALDEAAFEDLWPLTEGRRVNKTRYDVPLPEGLKAEVDVYDGALEGLVTAEVEFGDEQQAGAFDPPDWLGDEVTGDKRYANRTLATDGAPCR
jgi:adenylate cyclase